MDVTLFGRAMAKFLVGLLLMALGLRGYAEYRQRVRWKVIPYVW